MSEAYRDGLIDSEQEKERLKSPFPQDVSEICLEEVIKRLGGIPSILDVGCGPNPALARFVEEKLGARYFGLDINPVHLATLREEGVSGIFQANLLHLPVSEVDITHTRAVVAFFDPNQREEAIRSILGATKKVGIFIEHDYTNTNDWVGSLKEFRAVLLSILTKIGFDPYCGRDLKDEISEVLKKQGREAKIIKTRHEREPRNYYGELLGRAEELLGLAKKIGMSPEEQTLQSIIESLKEGSSQEKPPLFRTPDLVAVVVEFN